MGRQTELTIAAAAMRDLSQGRASVLVIEGEAGLGKTRLVECLVEDARPRDLAVWCGVAQPFERARPFGVVASAFGLTGRSLDPPALHCVPVGGLSINITIGGCQLVATAGGGVAFNLSIGFGLEVLLFPRGLPEALGWFFTAKATVGEGILFGIGRACWTSRSLPLTMARWSEPPVG